MVHNLSAPVVRFANALDTRPATDDDGTLRQTLDRLPFDKIVSNTFPLADVNAAFEQAEWDNRQTSVTRAVLVP